MTSHRTPILSCPYFGVQRTTRAECASRTGLANEPIRHVRPSLGFRALRRLRSRAATSRRACLTRLRCVFSLSQTLDAFFHPKPFSPCFMRVTPLGFCLQRLSLTSSELHLSVPLAPHVVSEGLAPSANRRSGPIAATPGICASGESVSTSTVLPAVCRPILS